MPEDFGDKSYDATPHRRQQAREQGQVAKSQDLGSAVLLVAAIVGLMLLGEGISLNLGHLARRQLGGEALLSADPEFAVNQWNAMARLLAQLLLPLFGILLLTAVVVNLGQVGFLFLPQKLALDLSRLSLLKGFGRLFALSNFVRLGFGLFKIGVVAAVAAWSLWSQQTEILALTQLELPQAVAFLTGVILWTCLKIALALLVLAILDYIYQKWKHEQDLKMTHQQVREEMKTTQGDPQVAARRRQVQRQLILNRMEGAVPQADVVVTNPTELAVALKYDHGEMAAPIVVAKGAGLLAQRIRRLALENDIPVIERKPLAQALYKNVEVNQPIPADQYAAVAEVLRYVYQLQGRTLPEAE